MVSSILLTVQVGRLERLLEKQRPPQSTEPRPAPEVVEELADGFTYAINRYQRGGHQARHTVQCRSKSSNDDILEVRVHRPDYTIYRVRVQVHQAEDAGQGQSECAAELTLNLREACRMRAPQEGPLGKVVASMVPVFPSGKFPISTFMPIHPAFSRAQQQFLDQLFARCCPPPIRSDAMQVFSTSGNVLPYNNQGDTPQDQVKKAIASVMGTWPDQVQDIGQPLRFPGCEVQQALVQDSGLASHQVGCAHVLSVNLGHLEPTEAKPEEPEERPASANTQDPARGPAPAWPDLKQRLKSLRRRLLSVPKAFSLAVLGVLSNYPE